MRDEKESFLCNKVDKMMILGHYCKDKEFQMEAYREIIAGSKLGEVIDLPDELKTSELEVLIFPVKKEIKKGQSFKPEDLPSHNMGKVLSPLDRNSIYSNER